MALRADLDGLRVRMPGSDAVYLIDQGMKRWIPSPAAYERLFRNWGNIHLDLHLDLIDSGSDFCDGVALLKCDVAYSPSGALMQGPLIVLSDSLYQTNPTNLRWIASPAVMERYQFDWSKVQQWPSGGRILYLVEPSLTKEGRPD